MLIVFIVKMRSGDRNRDRNDRSRSPVRSRKTGCKRVFVSNIPYEYKWKELKELFRKEGIIQLNNIPNLKFNKKNFILQLVMWLLLWFILMKKTNHAAAVLLSLIERILLKKLLKKCIALI